MTVTLTSIATEAGVSVMTVSRTLRGSGRVDDETRQRILAIADRVGYPRRGRDSVISSTGSGAVDAQYLRLLLVSTSADAEGGYTGSIRSVLAANLATSGGRLAHVVATDLDAIMHAAIEHRAQGVVLRSAIPLTWIEALVARMPVVYAVSFDHQCGVDSVYTNEHRSAAIIYQRLTDLGHRDIAWFSVIDRHQPVAHQFFEAMESSCLTDRLSASVHGVRHAAWTNLAQCQPSERRQPMILVERDWQRQDLNATVVDGANRLLALAPRPTAVVVSSEPVAQALIAELSRRGLGIPEACSLVTYGGSSADDGGWLARVELPMEAIATAIPELIRRRLANPAAPALSMQFETTLHAGASLAPPPKG